MILLGLEFPPDLVLGLVAGMTYGLLGIGLTLIYRTNRVLNFAHGEIGAIAALVIPLLVVNHGTSYWLALPLAVGASVAVGALIQVTVIRRLWNAPRLIVLVATIGLSQLLVVLQLLIPRGNLGQATFPVPFTWSMNLGGVRIPPGHLMILIAVPLITIALTLFFKRARLGIASRATADNQEAAQLTGIPIKRVSLVVWIIAGLLAGLSAILIGPTRPLLGTQSLGGLIILRALVAALVGGFASLGWTFVGGMAVGVLEFFVLWNWPTGGALEVVLLGVVLLLLLFRRGLSGSARGGEERSWTLSSTIRAIDPAVLRLPRVRYTLIGLRSSAVVLAVLLPVALSESQRTLAASVVIFAVICTSMVILTGYAGQVSLGQFAFVALGALVAGRLHQLGYPMGSVLVFVAAAGAVAALIVGVPALRIRGLYLAVATLSLAYAATSWLLGQPWLVAERDGFLSLNVPRPSIFGLDLGSPLRFYWFCLAFLVLIGAGVAHLRRTGIGRAMIAVRDNEPSAATLSLSPRSLKLMAFALSGSIAAIGGYLYGALLGNFSSQPQVIFSPEQSLLIVAMAIFGGVTTVTGAIVGALWFKGLAYWMTPLAGNVLGPRFGVLLGGAGLLIAVLQFPQGYAVELIRYRDKLLARLAGRPLHPLGSSRREEEGAERPPLPVRTVPATASAPSHSGNGHTGAGAPPPIAASHVTVRYGGIVAVDDVSLHADVGEVVGLIGPNGAGKTTLFDVLTGQTRPTAGRVLVHGYDVTKLRPEQRALLGVGRTFQQARLFDDLALRDAFKVALERDEPSELVPSLLSLPPSRAAERRKDLRADELVELLGLEGYAHRHVSELSTGTRRFAELGCMIALGAPILLLDEPTAGIAQREVEAFRPVLREVRDHLDATVVLIDHDLPMVLDLVDRLYVLATGRVIAEGDPHALRDDPEVVAAYLGTDERALSRSAT